MSLRDPEGSAALTARLLTQLNHRGPDGSGVLERGSSSIGMARLRVRSAASDDVPFTAGDEVHALNGEVYHAGGRTPAGGLEEALACAPGADGMYAVVSATRDGRLEVARDPLGIKPLFVRESDEGVAIASEVTPLLDAFGPAPVRREAFAQFLVTGRRVVDGGSFFEGIRPVRPGERLTVSGGKVVSTRHGGVAVPEPVGNGTPSAAELREAVSVAVDRVLLADRPIGLALSGGLDSTILAALLAERGVTDLPTVSICPEGSSDGVRELAELGLSGTRSWRHSWTPFEAADLLDELPSAVQVMGEPTGMSSLPMYARLARLARESGITVLVVGEGADELFGGYQRYANLRSGQHATALDFYLAEERRTMATELLGCDVVEEAVETFRGELPEGPACEVVRSHELQHSLEPLLRRTDHLLMAQGIEGRTPFLHGGVPALASRLTPSQLVRGGETKVALREAFSDLVGEGRREVPKIPFRAPVARWLGGSLLPRVDAELADSVGLLNDCLGVRPDGVQTLRKRLAGGQESAFPTAFNLLSTIHWLTWLESRG